MAKNLENNQDFIKMSKQKLANKIWSAANELRSQLDVTEYDKIILGLIFYKYLSSKQTETLIDKNGDYQLCQKNDEKSNNNECYLYIEDLTKSENPNQIVDSLKENLGFYIPYEYLFSSWNKKEFRSKFDRNYIIESINHFNSEIENINQQNSLYKNIFDEFYLSIQKVKNEDSIKKVVRIIDEIPTKKQDYDVLGFIYQYLIGEFASTAGKKAGEFYTPLEAGILMSEIISFHLSKFTYDKDDLIRIYDPTAGSGSLLIRVAEKFQKHMNELHHDIRIKYIAQEILPTSFKTLSMNLIMHNIPPQLINIREADTLEDDWPTESNGDKKVKAIVANPPYSHLWKPDNKINDPRFQSYGLAPKSKADYAFLLHSLYHLDKDGIMAIVLPHGVLFRGGSEYEIRKSLIKKQKIDTIIGLPNNMFMGTGISTIIMILKENKTTDDIMFVDGSKLFSKDGNKNKLDRSHIIKISDVVNNRIEKDGFSRIVSLKEIEENDYNLNISRYIDNYDKDEIHDLYSTMYGGVSDQEISVLNPFWNKFIGLKEKLISKRPDGYNLLNLKNDDLVNTVKNDSYVKEFIKENKDIANLIIEFIKKNIPSYENINEINVYNFESNFEEFILNIKDNAFIEKYDIYQVAIEKFEIIKEDIEIIQNYQNDNISISEILIQEKNIENNKNGTLVNWDARLIGKEFIIEKFFVNELNEIKKLKYNIDSIESEIKETFESIDEEEKDLPIFKENGFDNKELSKQVAILKKDKYALDNLELAEKLIHVYNLNNELKNLKDLLKINEFELLNASLEKYDSLDKTTFYDLLFYKWTNNITEKIIELVNKVIDSFINKIEKLFNKYLNTLNEINEEISKNESELVKLLTDLKADEYDQKAINELITILGGNKNEQK
ncbi:type I restriction-modification system subunit M [Mycoplasmopsis cynos]|uniref:type I restriction-modification system subunit M n=1 Tax=Mycoplasmopsis cynos TaxID=171284 RepID=UPI0030CFE6F5